MALTTENDKPTIQPAQLGSESTGGIPNEEGTGTTGEEGNPSDIQPPAETPTPPEPPVVSTPTTPPESEKPAPKKAKVLSVLEAQEKAAIIFLARRELDAPGMADFKNLFPALFEE